MSNVIVSKAAEVQKGHFDPYQLDPSYILEPPIKMGGILKKVGPGIVLSASVVGSGELIATTTLGAEVGYTVMWLILFSCLIKALIQSFLGRYTIAKGETGLEAFNRIPGKIGKVNWVVWAWAAMVKWGGQAQAWTLPILSLGTVFLIRRHLPREMRATTAGTVLLWIGAIVILGFVLISEARQWGILG